MVTILLRVGLTFRVYKAPENFKGLEDDLVTKISKLGVARWPIFRT